MNNELKRLSLITVTIFVVVTAIINLHSYLDSSRYIPEASRVSQVHNTNLLRHPNINHPSEHKSYPRLAGKKKLRVIAEPALKRVYVLQEHRVIYIMHAQVNLRARQLTVQGKNGQQLYQRRGRQLTAAINWTEFGHHYYFEALTQINHQSAKSDWLVKPTVIPGTIQLSVPDALWIQSLPKGTPLTIR